jgi:hypothetical protein
MRTTATRPVTRSVTTLRIGDILVLDNGSQVRIERLDACLSARRGVPKVHVNNNLCYDMLQPVYVLQPSKKGN